MVTWHFGKIDDSPSSLNFHISFTSFTYDYISTTCWWEDLNKYANNDCKTFVSIIQIVSYQIVKLPNCQVTKLSSYHIVRLPNCQVTKLSGYQIVGYQIVQLLNFQVTKLLVTKMLVTKLLVTNNPPIPQ